MFQSWEQWCSRLVGYYMVLGLAAWLAGDVPDVYFLVPPLAALKRPTGPFSESRRSV